MPNSDLISGQVTNWTLGNTWGRAKVQVGVAYGIDVETVIETLLEVANEHEDVISDINRGINAAFSKRWRGGATVRAAPREAGQRLFESLQDLLLPLRR